MSAPDLNNVLAALVDATTPECMKCGERLDTDEKLYYSFIATFRTPSIPTPSPPHVLCDPCGWRTAAYMGVRAAKRHCKEKGLAP